MMDDLLRTCAWTRAVPTRSLHVKHHAAAISITVHPLAPFYIACHGAIGGHRLSSLDLHGFMQAGLR